MIRLTINAYTEPKIHLFNKSTILIGSDTSQVDLILNGTSIKNVHLKIVEQNGVFFALNLINDPFTSINELPFGKKQLKSGDKLQIYQDEIQFENLNEEQLHQEKVKKNLEIPLDNSNSEKQFLQIHFPFEEEVELLEEEELKGEKFDSLLNEFHPIEDLSDENFSNTTHLKASENSTDREFKTSLKDDNLLHLEDDGLQEKANSVNENELQRKPKKKIIFIFCISIFLVATVIGSLIFFNITQKSEGQEVKATQGVADIGMALTHAQLYHIKPHNLNWLDVDFLKSSLQSIIPNAHSYALNLDGQGKFNCCPYNLRIYTNRDLSRFLLIAQPVSGFLNGFISKSIIVLDSELMELRTFKDVRNINRLLANAEPLEGVNGKEISSLVRNGQLIRLSMLAYESKNFDFSPPKNVAWIKPGAENYVYNAPRYYRLAQNLLQKAMNLSTSKGTGQEVAMLKQDVSNFSKLIDLILYSDNEKSASLSKRSIMLFAPSDKLLFGYLQFSHGQFVEAHLLKEENEMSESAFTEVPPISEPVVMADDLLIPAISTHNDNQEPDFNHPIYIQLEALVMTRENELRPLSAAIYYLLSQELDAPKAYFQTEFQNLYHTYLITSGRHKQIIKETIMKLYHQYEEMPVIRFINFINSVHLNHLIMQKDETLSFVDENCIQNLQNIFKHIQKCQSLLELDNLVHIALTWLNFDYLKDPEELIKYQNLLRNHILDQLKAFLIANIKLVQIKAEDKGVLNHILDHERLINFDEKEFFLIEFEELIQKEKKSAHLLLSVESENLDNTKALTAEKS